MLTQERLKQLLRYDAETGLFSRVVIERGRGRMVSRPNSRGYLNITVDRKQYLLHRLVWFYVHGEWPAAQIDHVNGDKNDNRLCNLRLATMQQNNANKTKTRLNTSGFKGVSWARHANAYRAMITVNNKPRHLGYRKSAEEAHKLYMDAAIQHFGEYAKG